MFATPYTDQPSPESKGMLKLESGAAGRSSGCDSLQTVAKARPVTREGGVAADPTEGEDRAISPPTGR